jgi:hypothetical protein
MASLTEAFDSVNSKANERDNYENPQAFHRLVSEAVNPKAARHVLGLVGGNEVSVAWNQMTDIESDLRGTTRPNTWCTMREHLPPDGSVIIRRNPKQNIVIDSTATNLTPVQAWAYPAVIGPEPFRKETCGAPEKY